MNDIKEDQAFSPYDLAIPPSPSLPSPVSKLLDRRHTERLRKRDNKLTEAGSGVGEETIHAAARKPSPL
jgi:hypothetical protein